jgi:internalin A
MNPIILMIAVVALVGCGGTIDLTTQPELEKAIREHLKATRGVMPTGELTKADLEKVTELTIVGVTEPPKGLEKLTQLEKLSLYNNQLTDLKGLEKLTKLTALHLNDNQLTEVPKSLEKLTQLTTLHLERNKLTDVKGLEKLTQLKSLSLVVNQLTDVRGLEKHTQLRELDLRHNPDLTIAQIEELQKALPKCKIYRTLE